MPFRGGTRHQPTAGRTRGDAASFGGGRSSTTGIARGTNTAGQITGEQLHPRGRGAHGNGRTTEGSARPGDHGNSCTNGGLARPGDHGDLLGQRGDSQGPGNPGNSCSNGGFGGTVIRGDHGGSQRRRTTGALRTGRSTDGTAVQRGSQDKQGTKDKHGRSTNGDAGTQYQRGLRGVGRGVAGLGNVDVLLWGGGPAIRVGPQFCRPAAVLRTVRRAKDRQARESWCRARAASSCTEISVSTGSPSSGNHARSCDSSLTTYSVPAVAVTRNCTSR
ncbi:hypothetical protein EV645_0804 [Kribbella rubisoli]|uniref:Uncharacterized protein n=1 Tax=Kribbella rubisoli TaxID=3075929 RepID=A0A4Q7X6N2_9ACTN|nr:hypothetical protein EV645_0804 [Kribbella rubisoli]